MVLNLSKEEIMRFQNSATIMEMMKGKTIIGGYKLLSSVKPYDIRDKNYKILCWIV